MCWLDVVLFCFVMVQPSFAIYNMRENVSLVCSSSAPRSHFWYREVTAAFAEFLMLDNDGVFSGSLSSGEETRLEHKVQYSGQVPSLPCLQKASQFESCPVLCEVTEMLGINYGWGLPARGDPIARHRDTVPDPVPLGSRDPEGDT